MLASPSACREGFFSVAKADLPALSGQTSAKAGGDHERHTPGMPTTEPSGLSARLQPLDRRRIRRRHSHRIGVEKRWSGLESENRPEGVHQIAVTLQALRYSRSGSPGRFGNNTAKVGWRK